MLPHISRTFNNHVEELKFSKSSFFSFFKKKPQPLDYGVSDIVIPKAAVGKCS